MKKIINLTEEFPKHLCSFELAKKAKACGFTTANTFFAYNSRGEITTGGFMGNMGYEVYPAINTPLAICMMEECRISEDDIKNSVFYEEDGKYHFEIKGFKFSAERMPDVFVSAWLKLNHNI